MLAFSSTSSSVSFPVVMTDAILMRYSVPEAGSKHSLKGLFLYMHSGLSWFDHTRADLCFCLVGS